MPEPDDDLARLQRLAFGSGASESERADAARELEALLQARAAAVEAEQSAVAASAASAADAGAAHPDAAGAAEAGEPPAESVGRADTAQRTRLRRAVVVGVAALVVGLLAGWQLGTTVHATAESAVPTPTATPYEGPRTMADYLESQPLALDLPAADVFTRPATEADVPPLPVDFNVGHGPLEFRYLLTRPGGLTDAGSVERRYYAARDEVELCLFVTTVGTESTSELACTTDGRFPVGGISSAAGTLSPDGTLSFPISW